MIILTRDNLVSKLVDKLDDMEVLDSRNYANTEYQKEDIVRYIKLFLDDYIIIEGGRVL